MINSEIGTTFAQRMAQRIVSSNQLPQRPVHSDSAADLHPGGYSRSSSPANGELPPSSPAYARFDSASSQAGPAQSSETKTAPAIFSRIKNAFMPTSPQALKNAYNQTEIKAEHALLQLQTLSPSHPKYDAKVQTLRALLTQAEQQKGSLRQAENAQKSKVEAGQRQRIAAHNAPIDQAIASLKTQREQQWEKFFAYQPRNAQLDNHFENLHYARLESLDQQEAKLAQHRIRPSSSRSVSPGAV